MALLRLDLRGFGREEHRTLLVGFFLLGFRTGSTFHGLWPVSLPAQGTVLECGCSGFPLLWAPPFLLLSRWTGSQKLSITQLWQWKRQDSSSQKWRWATFNTWDLGLDEEERFKRPWVRLETGQNSAPLCPNLHIFSLHIFSERLEQAHSLVRTFIY